MSFSEVIQLAGGLAIFLYGMKLMSEALQRVAGSGMRALLQAMTRNRVAGVISGMLATILVQSSSATTVMLVGFVNAGLLNLSQSIGVIMGANIGTTITAWLVAALGFEFKIANFALPAIVFGLIMHFFNSSRWMSRGNVLIGFGFLFFGLNLIKLAIPDAASHPDAFEFLKYYSGNGVFSLIFFIIVGMMITVLLQSSSATSAITITLAHKGLIPFEAAAAMILGENIGTTVTANLAALAGNREARKAALAHTMFNFLGVIWAIIFFNWLLAAVDWIVPGNPLLDQDTARFHISAFHTGFNVVNTLVLIGFVPQLTRLLNRSYDTLGSKFRGKTRQDKSRFRLLGAGPVRTTTLALYEIEDYLRQIALETLADFKDVQSLMLVKYKSGKGKILKINEEKLDNFRDEMQGFLTDIQASGVRGAEAREVLELMKRVSLIEDLGDYYVRISNRMKRASKRQEELNATDRMAIENLIGLINSQIAILEDLYNNEGKTLLPNFDIESRNKANELYKFIEKTAVEAPQDQSVRRSSLLLLDLSRTLRDIVENLADQTHVSNTLNQELKA